VLHVKSSLDLEAMSSVSGNPSRSLLVERQEGQFGASGCGMVIVG
jgi:hypothetical protein